MVRSPFRYPLFGTVKRKDTINNLIVTEIKRGERQKEKTKTKVTILRFREYYEGYNPKEDFW